MRFSTEVKTLKAALRTVRGAVGNPRHMPILGNARIEVVGKRVTIAATDLEVGLIVDLGETVTSGNGIAVVPLKALEGVLKNAKKGRVDLKTEEGSYLRIEGEGCQATLAGNPPDKYPTLPDLPGSGETQLLSGLRAALGSVFHAVSTDETRYNLNGIAIDADAGHCIATDGHRLAVADASPIRLPWKGIQIIPLKPAKLLCKLLKGSGDCARVAFDGKNAGFHGEGFSFTIRMIEGEYPNYHQVIPKRSVETIRVDRDALLEGIASVEHCSPERSRAVKVTLNSGIGLETSNPDLGDASAHVDAVRGRGEADTVKTLALNGNYLCDALKTLDAGEIAIGIAGNKMVGKISDYASSPIKLYRSETEYPFCIIMPMRI